MTFWQRNQFLIVLIIILMMGTIAFKLNNQFLMIIALIAVIILIITRAFLHFRMLKKTRQHKE